MGKCVKVDFEGKANNKGEDKDDNFERGSSYTYRKKTLKQGQVNSDPN